MLAYPEDRVKELPADWWTLNPEQIHVDPWFGDGPVLTDGCYIDGVPISEYEDWEQFESVERKLLLNPGINDIVVGPNNSRPHVEEPPGSSTGPPPSIPYKRGERARELAAEIELHFGRMSFNPANQTIAHRFASRHDLVGGDVRTVHRLRLVRRALEIYFTTVEEDLVHAYTIDNNTNRKRSKQLSLAGVFNRWFGHSTTNRPLQA
jgi:hypothetical protein